MFELSRIFRLVSGHHAAGHLQSYWNSQRLPQQGEAEDSFVLEKSAGSRAESEHRKPVTMQADFDV